MQEIERLSRLLSARCYCWCSAWSRHFLSWGKPGEIKASATVAFHCTSQHRLTEKQNSLETRRHISGTDLSRPTNTKLFHKIRAFCCCLRAIPPSCQSSDCPLVIVFAQPDLTNRKAFLPPLQSHSNASCPGFVWQESFPNRNEWSIMVVSCCNTVTL